MSQSTNHCCAMMHFNFAILETYKIWLKLRVIFQFTHSIKTKSVPQNKIRTAQEWIVRLARENYLCRRDTLKSD